MPANDKLALAHETLARAVEDLVSGEDWAAMLGVAARFHRYSANNVMLIMAQRPDATRVAGFRTWLSLGRHVRRGEKGLAILAPMVIRHRPPDGDDPEAVVRVLRGFRVAHVFDLSQTDGEPLADVTPALLHGEAPLELWDALSTQVRAAGYELAREDCSPANGVTDYSARRVTVAPGLAEAQAVKTLAHELGHVLLHENAEDRSCRGVAEVEAESVAYLVAQAAGLDSSGYSFAYVARWAGGDPRLVMTTAERVISTARSILERIGTARESQGVAC